MKLKWSRKVDDIEEYYELENETVGEIIVVYQAIEGIVNDYETEPELKIKPEVENESY